MSNETQVISIARNQEIDAMWQNREAELNTPVIEAVTPEVNPLDVLAAEVTASQATFNPRGSKSKHSYDPKRFIKRGEAAKRSDRIKKVANELYFSQIAEVEFSSELELA